MRGAKRVGADCGVRAGMREEARAREEEFQIVRAKGERSGEFTEENKLGTEDSLGTYVLNKIS